MTLVIAVDPGEDGAAVGGDQDGALFAYHWLKRGKADAARFDLYFVADTEQGPCDELVRRGLISAHHVGLQLAQHAWPWVMARDRLTVAAEDMYVGKNARTAVELAKFAGALAGPLGHLARGGQVDWVSASSWRAVSFRSAWWKKQAEANGQAASKRTATALGLDVMPKREAAKREALMVLPSLVNGLVELLERVPERQGSHVADAAGVMRWALIQRR